MPEVEKPASHGSVNAIVAKLDTAKLDTAKLDTAKLDTAKLDTAKLDTAKLDTAKQRIVFVDLLRLLASIQMVHGHTLSALMLPALKHGPIYSRWSFMRGTTSVVFLFASGLSYYIATLTRFDSFKGSPVNRLRRVRRAAWLVTVGYLLQLYPSMVTARGAAAATAWRRLWRVDVLHCIGASLLLLHFVAARASSARQVVACCSLLAPMFLLLAPWADGISSTGWLRPLLNYMSHGEGSQFPLFPWSGYLFLGVVAGAFVLPSGRLTRPTTIAYRSFALSAAAVMLYLLVSSGLLNLLRLPHTSPATHPYVVALKLASTLPLFAVAALVSIWVNRLPRVLAAWSRQSLSIYVIHLVLLYGFGFGIARWYAHKLDIAMATILAFEMVGVTLALAWAWDARKQHQLGAKG